MDELLKQIEMAIAKLKPNDIVTLTLDQMITNQQRVIMLKNLESIFSEEFLGFRVKVLILEPGTKMEIIRSKESGGGDDD